MPTQASIQASIDALVDDYAANVNPFFVKKKVRNPKTSPVEEDDMESIIPAADGFTFGADPEMFIFGPDGEPVSADGIIPGTKANPHKVPCGAVQRDGFAAEFNIDPAKDFATFNKNIETVMAEMTRMLPPGHTLRAVPSVVFSEAEFDRSSDDAKELGCSPDHDAWTGGVNPPPSLPDNPRLRCAGGHIHIGWTEGASLSDLQHITNCRDLVKQLDWYLGGWSLRIDDDNTRRSLYGKAGACRMKDYGVEYRVLSNFWITTKSRRLTVWNRLQKAVNDMRTHYMPDLVSRYNPVLVESINAGKRSSILEREFRYPLQSYAA